MGRNQPRGMEAVNSQRPTPKSQNEPREKPPWTVRLGVGSWRLGVDAIGCGGRRLALVLALAAWPIALHAQSITVRAAGDMLHLRASGLGLIEARVADHLRDGRAVRVDFAVAILEKAGGRLIAQVTQSFNLSFDIWEQRYAVTKLGATPRSVSHLTARDAESWCVDNVTVPLSAMGRIGRDMPFWVRLEFRVPDPMPVANADDDSTFTLGRLINVLSRRRQDQEAGRAIEGGPFRLN